MLFDPSNLAVSKNGVHVGKLRQLSEALRREMPPGFEWDFRDVFVRRRFTLLRSILGLNDCGTVGCAIGLARYEGILTGIDSLSPHGLSNGHYSLFGLSKEETALVFADHRFYGMPRLGYVMPCQVADAIDRIIAREEV